MVYELGEKIETLIHDHAGENLRSIIVYTTDEYDIRYVRDDVEENYDAEEIERALEELRLETLQREYINSIFAEKHGEFISNILTFTDAVEMNFLIDDGVGMAVAVDREYFEEQGLFIHDLSKLLTERFKEGDAFERFDAAADGPER